MAPEKAVNRSSEKVRVRNNPGFAQSEEARADAGRRVAHKRLLISTPAV